MNISDLIVLILVYKRYMKKVHDPSYVFCYITGTFHFRNFKKMTIFD